MTSIINASTEIAAANGFSHSIRLLKVAHTASHDPSVELQELSALETGWVAANNVTVANFSATCFLTGSMLQLSRGYPIGLIDSSWAGVGITTLSSRTSCARCAVDALVGCPGGGSSAYFPTNATSVYNTMIAPLHRITVFGILWWQGENSGPGCSQQRTNTTLATYYCLWQALIADWRARWAEQSSSGAELPFGFVQLEPTANPAIRWDETAHRISVPNRCLPRVFMAAALDFGDTVAGVHTRYKRPICARLALAAEAVAYNETSVYYTGPVAAAAAPSDDGKTLVVTFNSSGAGGILLRDGGGFSVCSVKHAALCWEWANDEYFANATATLGTEDNQIELAIPPDFEGPVGVVRYEWKSLPCNWPALESCPVYSKENNLPAPPFMLGVGPSGPQPPPCLDTAFIPPQSTDDSSLLPSGGTDDSPPTAPRSAFKHPGVFVNADQIAFIRKQVKIAGTPFNTTAEKVIKDTWLNSRNTSSMSPEWNGTIACGIVCLSTCIDAYATCLNDFFLMPTVMNNQKNGVSSMERCDDQYSFACIHVLNARFSLTCHVVQDTMIHMTMVARTSLAMPPPCLFKRCCG